MCWYFFIFKSSGYRPNKNNCGSKGIWICKMFWIRSFISRQNVCISVHCQIQWKNVPFSFSHLIQTSGIALLYLLSFLINQLYCNTFRRVLVVLHCALEHASSHFSIGIASCRSSLHASSCPADVSVLPSTWHLYILDIKPLPKQFTFISFSMVDISGIHNVWFWCVLMKFLNCRYFKKMITGYVKFINHFSKCQQHLLRVVKVSYFSQTLNSPRFKSPICFTWREGVISPYRAEDRERGHFSLIFFNLMPDYNHIFHNRVFCILFKGFCSCWLQVYWDGQT